MSQLLYEYFKRQLPKKQVNSVMFLNRRALTGKLEPMTSMATNTYRTIIVLGHGKLRLERPSDREITQMALTLSLQRASLHCPEDQAERSSSDDGND
ncbi:protein UL19 [Cercopithecine betaherpesvirus 5]|uniref:Protein UL19 n=1 Tax=Simian cytomegalovirus (strain Colburn) TaxID=50292 RepID=G8XTS5_SCMVC|nr:protein UL19 [Cercopithecine betaherpesvirus 5]AEV80384.1 protein UL19 [Cercopithecine betaherpesvirus 5]AEV80567.1 protein UL19 [Cercopithecine betaherpesvirus 5]